MLEQAETRSDTSRDTSRDRTTDLHFDMTSSSKKNILAGTKRVPRYAVSDIMEFADEYHDTLLAGNSKCVARFAGSAPRNARGTPRCVEFAPSTGARERALEEPTRFAATTLQESAVTPRDRRHRA
jgi:hypothetical protein